MKERPILFSAPMVRAILSGQKTQTRRIVKFNGWSSEMLGKYQHAHVLSGEETQRLSCAQPADTAYAGFFLSPDANYPSYFRCPYGQPGDRLWVRETIYAWGRWETRYSEKKGRDEWHFIDMTLECGKQYRYPASMIGANGTRQRGCVTPQWWKRPAIHAPRAASRILLEITAVRVERLQEISEEQAEAEGTQGCVPYCQSPYDSDGAPACDCMNLTYKESFQALWSSINGAKSWAANPWVWVVQFQRVEST